MLDKITVDNLSDLFKTTLSYKKNNDLEFFCHKARYSCERILQIIYVKEFSPLPKVIKLATNLYCGIDVSGDSLDICYQTNDGTLEWNKFTNNQEGFREIWKLTGKHHHFIIESTGVYQLPFCFFLKKSKQGTV